MFRSLHVPAAMTILALASLLGCQRTASWNQPGYLTPDPVLAVEDEAMHLRVWDQSTAYFENGDVIAGPTLFLFEPKPYEPEYVYPVIETPLFLANVVLMPVAAVITPPWSEVVYEGVITPPTYTAMPVTTLSGEVIDEPFEPELVEPEPMEAEPAEPVEPMEAQPADPAPIE